MRLRGRFVAGALAFLTFASASVATAQTSTKKKKPAAATAPSKAVEPESNAGVIEPPKPDRAPAATIEPEELVEFSTQPPRVRQLLTSALSLTKLNLTYTFGSDDPARGGMDCSGTIFRVLMDGGFPEAPRDSSGQYSWVRKKGEFFAVVSKVADSFEFAELLPGDLLFWTGTYQTGRDVPISHVMLYLGREKKSGKRVMFGASDGRSYAGVQRWGVSVFDFKMPKSDPAQAEKPVDFVGYGRIPGLRETGETPANAASTPEPKPEPVEVKKRGKNAKAKSAGPKTISGKKAR